MHGWGIAESSIIDKLVRTYANYLENNHCMDRTEALMFVDELVMILIDYISGNPTGGKRIATGQIEKYLAVISLPQNLNLRFLFKEVYFEWTVDYPSKKLILEWFKLVPW